MTKVEITWREWFARVGRPDADAVSGPNFSDHALMIEAAAAGHGVALGSMICADPYLRPVQLKILAGPVVPSSRLSHLLRSANLRR